jgi:hypothetical protein
MDGRDQCLGVVNGKGVDFRALVFPQTRTMEALSGVLLGRAVSITEIKGVFENANNIVVGLLAPGLPISDRYKMRVTASA